MARDHDRHRIAIVGHADGAKGVRLADGVRDIGVGAGLAVGNRQQGTPAGELKVGSAQIERKGELAALAGKVLFQLVDVVPQGTGRGLEAETVLFGP